MVVKQPQFTRVEEPTLLCNQVESAEKAAQALLRFPDLSDGMRRPVSTGCVTLPIIDVLEAQEKGDRL